MGIIQRLALLCGVLCFADGAPSLLFAASKDIRLANTGKSSSKGTILIRDLDEASAMNYCYELGIICWSDRHREVVQCVKFSNQTIIGPKEVFIKSYASPMDGIACDWVTGKLYWSDSETNRIEVISFADKHRKVLIWDDIDQPRAIVLVPQKRIMFWTDWGEVPKIERAGMDGSNGTRKVIVSEDIFWPNGLAIDYERELLYWVDGKLKFLASADYDGKNRKKIIQGSVVEYPYGIAYFRNKIYWSDWQSWSIYELDVSSNTSYPRKVLHSEVAITDVRVFEPQLQPKMNTSCSINNGGCSHLCLLSPNPAGYSCACPTGIKLIDSFNCANGSQEFLIVVQRTDICKMSLDSPDYTLVQLPLYDIEHAIAVDYDPVAGDIYWTDDEKRVIRKATVHGTMQKDVITTHVQHPDGIAIDWIARNFFWTDTGTDRIEVANLQGQYRKVIINKDLKEPRGIAVAPEHGLIFWSDWHEEHPKIERACMDGSDRRLLVQQDLAWPNGITVDRAGELIFWCDAKTDKIESCHFDGSNRREVISDHLYHPFGISLLGDHIYWTDWSQRNIERVNRFTGERQVIAEQISNIMDVRAVRLGSNLGWNPCADNNGGCNHLCLNRPNNYICACELEYELSNDLKTCVRPVAFLLFAREETIGSISIENNYNDNRTMPLTDVVRPSGLDMDKTSGRIYWSDSGARSITRAFINGSGVEKIVEFGLETPQGIAVDWISQNVYWADSGARRIEVARLDGRSRRVLLWKEVINPMSLTVDPKLGLLFWTDWESSGGSSRSVGAIMKAAMDGTQVTAILSGVGRANGLTIDYKTKKLYWGSQRPGIEMSNLDGSHWQTLITYNVPNPTGLAQFQDRIYWSDWITDTIESADKMTGLNRTVVHGGLRHVSDIMVYQEENNNDRNRCSSNNGGCSDLCLPRPGDTYTCHCPHHYTLSSDNHTCVAPTTFLMFSQKTSIHRLVPDTEDCPDMMFPIHGLKSVRAITFDPVTQLLYWIDSRAHAIKSSLGSSGKLQTVVQVREKNLRLHDLVVDPFSRILFWSCSSSDVINATRLDIPNKSMDVIFSNNGFKPRELALHPEMGYLLWIDVALKGRIVRSRLDGSNVTVLIKDLREITAITVDGDKIYFSYDINIDVMDINGRNRRIVVSGAEVQNLAVQEDALYWVLSKSVRVIESANKRTGGDRRTILTRVSPTDLISVQFPSERAYLKQPCSHMNKHTCSHICLPVETKERDNIDLDGIYYDDLQSKTDNFHIVIRAQCACPMYQMLHTDGRSCTNIPVCQNKFMCSSDVLPNKDCIPDIWRCDGQKDCSDGSDERGCPTCGPSQYRCLNGQCIDKASVCDHKINCPDGSDEARCCQPGEFMCLSSSRCIPESVVCDGASDCDDESDESREMCLHRNVAPIQYDKGASTYVIASCAVLLCAILIPSACIYYRRKSPLLQHVRGEAAGELLGPKPFQENSSLQTPRTQDTMVSMSAVFSNSSAAGISYDRNNITGASSSSTSNALSCGAYPAETLNPPPSPATVRTDSRRCCGSSGSRYRPYRHYRAINQPPPPTPCETDVCDESDYGYRPQTESEYMSYSKGTASECDSDPFPPPPTPSSCPPSPSSTYWNPLPPPPSPVSRHHH